MEVRISDDNSDSDLSAAERRYFPQMRQSEKIIYHNGVRMLVISNAQNTEDDKEKKIN